MCDFKVGDEVVCIFAGPWDHPRGRLFAWLDKVGNRQPILGARYTITLVGISTSGSVCVDLKECPAGYNGSRRLAWAARHFRKVQRRDLQSWLRTSVPSTDHLDKPLPAKKRERV